MKNGIRVLYVNGYGKIEVGDSLFGKEVVGIYQVNDFTYSVYDTNNTRCMDVPYHAVSLVVYK